MLIDLLHSGRRNRPCRGRIELQRLSVHAQLRHAAMGQNTGNAARRIRAATEAEQINPITRPPEPDDRFVAVDDVRGQPEAGCLT